jgi:hypothetical protein
MDSDPWQTGFRGPLLDRAVMRGVPRNIGPAADPMLRKEEEKSGFQDGLFGV